MLFTRPSWSRAFVDAVDAGKIAAADVPLDQVRILANHDDPELQKRIEKIWGTVRPGTPEEKLAVVRRLNNDLNAGPGDPVKGKVVFELNCAKCHQLFGEGAKVAPELTQANRMDREYMLVSLVDPNLTIRKEYLQYIVETNDGGVFNGLIAERTPGSIVLLNANNVRTTIAMGDVADVREAQTSLMPEGLVTPLSGDDLRNLFAYLQVKGRSKPSEAIMNTSTLRGGALYPGGRRVCRRQSGGLHLRKPPDPHRDPNRFSRTVPNGCSPWRKPRATSADSRERHGRHHRSARVALLATTRAASSKCRTCFAATRPRLSSCIRGESTMDKAGARRSRRAWRTSARR